MRNKIRFVIAYVRVFKWKEYLHLNFHMLFWKLVSDVLEAIAKL